MGRPKGRVNGDYAWQEPDWAIAYSLICSGKTQPSIIADAVAHGLPNISRRMLGIYISILRAKYNYPEPEKGMKVPRGGFNYDGTPLWDLTALETAYKMLCEGEVAQNIIAQADAFGLPHIQPLLFRKYLFWYCKEIGVPYPRKPQ
jgi:hypothetical protein